MLSAGAALGAAGVAGCVRGGPSGFPSARGNRAARQSVCAGRSQQQRYVCDAGGGRGVSGLARADGAAAQRLAVARHLCGDGGDSAAL